MNKSMKWATGANSIEEGAVRLVRDTNGVHAVAVNGELAAHFSLEAEMGEFWIVQKLDGREIILEEIEDIFDHFAFAADVWPEAKRGQFTYKANGVL
jgi:hypothetical protein